MNYLSHFYFNASGNDPQFHLGVALPDLMSACGREWRFHRQAVEFKINQNENLALWQGIKNHLEMDARFHQSDFFKSCYNIIRPFLSDRLSPYAQVRFFFIAHIGIEMLLDHVLLWQEPLLAKRFYQTLEKISAEKIRLILEDYFRAPLNDWENSFQQFMKVRYLEKYIELPNVAYGLNRMLVRTRQEPLEGKAYDYFLEALSECVKIIETHLPILMKEFNGQPLILN